MKKAKNVDQVIRLLKQETKTYPEAMSTQIANETKDPFKVLISCIMSLRTKDTTTLPAAKRLFALADTPKKMSALSLKQIERAIFPVGFYPTKAKYIKKTCHLLMQRFNGNVPSTMDELLTLSGIGRKCGALTMVYGHGKPEYIAVDVHVQVISQRLGWVKTTNPDQTMDVLMNIIPKKYWYDFNELLVKHGQQICTTQSPWCSKCAINNYCSKVGVKRKR